MKMAKMKWTNKIASEEVLMKKKNCIGYIFVRKNSLVEEGFK